MSQPQTAPAEFSANPVETQDDSAGGEPQARSIVEDEIKDATKFKEAVNKAVREQFSVTDAWKPKVGIRFFVQFPSGQDALVKHLDPMDLVKHRLLDDLNNFQKTLFPSELDDTGRPVDKKGKSLQEILTDVDDRVSWFDMTNRLLTAALSKPEVINDGVAKWIPPGKTDEEEVFGYQVEDPEKQIELFGKLVPKLVEGQAYAGTIGVGDRMTIFNEVNKPLGMIQPFRESPVGAEDTPTVQVDGDSTE